MDKNGFDMRIVSLSAPGLHIFEPEKQPDLARTINDESIRFARAHFDRLRVLASLPLADVEASLKELDRVSGAEEVVGIAMGSNVNGVSLSDQRFEPLWSRINELRMPVVEHPMHNPAFSGELSDLNLSTAIGYMFDTQLMVTRLIMNGIFERYPDFPFVVAHTGAGLLGILKRIDRAAARHPACKSLTKPFSEYARGLYYDTCSFYEPSILQAHEFTGAGHMMFGTDYPFIGSGSDHVSSLGIPEPDKQALMGGTAARIFRLDATQQRRAP
jgi:aminocarboxymuconate-semialdehyde decarboxylase